jgi:hypothetical protein
VCWDSRTNFVVGLRGLGNLGDWWHGVYDCNDGAHYLVGEEARWVPTFSIRTEFY